MKAKIYGFDVEGTPEEIAEFKKLIDSQQQLTYGYPYPVIQPYVYPTTSPLKWTEITCNNQT